MSDNNNKFFTIQEASDFLKVSKTSLRRWSNSGRLPCYRVGNRNERRFLLNDLLDFLSDSESTATSSSTSAQTLHSATTSQNNASQHHISSYYRNETDQWQALAPYLSQHLNEKKNRIIYIYDSNQDCIYQQFLKLGYDPDTLQNDKTLNLISAKQSYLLEGVFIPDRMLNFWQQHIGQAMMDGIDNILLTGEMGWAARGFPGSDLLCAYEIELDKFLKNFPMVTVVCQYPLKAFSGDIIFDSICAHPHLQINDKQVSGIEI